MKQRLMFVTLTGLATLMAGLTMAAEPSVQSLGAADQAELMQIEALLQEPAAHEGAGAVRALANLASKYRAIPFEVRDLLEHAATNPDPEIAHTAAEALSRMDARAHAEFDPEPMDTPESRDRAELARIEALLANPEEHERPGAGLDLVNHAGTSSDLRLEVRSLLELARDDGDPRVAKPAAAFLAQVDGTPVEGAAPLRLSEESTEALKSTLALLQDPVGGERLLALALLRDMLLPDSEAQVRIDAFRFVLFDEDPKVRNYASFALAAMVDGDPDALAQVHVGVPVNPGSTGGLQPTAIPQSNKGEMSPGYVTPEGVFVGTTSQFQGDPSLQPISDNRAGRLHEGYLDEFGVFVGTAPAPRPGADGRQPLQ